MTSKLVHASPEETMVIRDINPSITTLSVPFLRFGMIKFGGRATIVKLKTNSLFVFSPVTLTPTVKSKLSTLGTVKYICAPDIEHHIHLSAWHDAFPTAHIIAPNALIAKREKAAKSDSSITTVPIATAFTKENKTTLRVSEEFDAEFEYEFVDAHPNQELVFFHKPTKTLIEADMMFNLPATEQYSKTGEDASSGWATWLFSKFQNTRGDAIGQRRFVWYAFSAKDRVGFGKSVNRINGWGFENVVPCHGDTILGQGKEVWERVFKWHLEGTQAGK